MSKRPNNKTHKTKCYAAIDAKHEIVSFFKKLPELGDDGNFYGDLMFEYPINDFPKLTHQNSPYKAIYDGTTGEIIVKY